MKTRKMSKGEIAWVILDAITYVPSGMKPVEWMAVGAILSLGSLSVGLFYDVSWFFIPVMMALEFVGVCHILMAFISARSVPSRLYQ